MQFLVTGGTGSIGSALVRTLLKEDKAEITILSRNDSRQHDLKMGLAHDHRARCRFVLGDIRDRDTVERAMDGAKTIFHCAAIKHVVGSHSNPGEAASINIQGTRTVFEAANREAKHGGIINLIHLSTDKAAGPSNVMGASKFIAEKIVLEEQIANDLRRVVVRFGNVWNSSGSVFPTWMTAVKNHRTIYITDERVTRYVITIKRAVETLMKAMGFLTHAPQMFIPEMRQVSLGQIFSRVMRDSGITEYDLIKTIGLQQGEKLHEALITEEELKYVSMYNPEVGVLLNFGRKSDPEMQNYFASCMTHYLNSELAFPAHEEDFACFQPIINP